LSIYDVGHGGILAPARSRRKVPRRNPARVSPLRR
jgi:hypothetical protein